MIVTQPESVLEYVKQNAVNGMVKVKLASPRVTNFFIHDGKTYPDQSSLIHEVIVPISAFLVKVAKCMIGEYKRLVLTSNNIWDDVIVVKDGTIVQDGWLQELPMCNHKRIVVNHPIEIIGEWSKPISVSTPVPTKTYWSGTTVTNTINNTTVFMVIETRGHPITNSNVNEFLGIGLFFNSNQDALDFIQQRMTNIHDEKSSNILKTYKTYNELFQ